MLPHREFEGVFQPASEKLAMLEPFDLWPAAPYPAPVAQNHLLV
jgi:hypothetical protein